MLRHSHFQGIFWPDRNPCLEKALSKSKGKLNSKDLKIN